MRVGEHGTKIKSMEQEIVRLKDENSVAYWRPRWQILSAGSGRLNSMVWRRMKISCTIDALHKVAPHAQFKLENVIDIIIRVGRKDPNGKFPRSIIILFAMRRHRDFIWKSARNNGYLRGNNLRISEPLSPEDQAMRDQLWSLVQKARLEGKKASFRGQFAFVEGRRINLHGTFADDSRGRGRQPRWFMILYCFFSRRRFLYNFLTFIGLSYYLCVFLLS